MARQFPRTLLEFQRSFPDDAACAAHLEKLRWPAGFTCPGCMAAGAPYRFRERPTVLRCRACRVDTRLTAGTVMHDTHTPLLTWFWSAYLVTTQTPGISALQLQRLLGIKRYETAFHLLHKLRAAMVRPARDRIGTTGWHVEVDESFVGGRTRGKGRGRTEKVIVAGAVEVRLMKKSRRRGERQLFAGRLRLALVPGRGRTSLESFVQAAVEPGTTVVTDGWFGYDAIQTLGYEHHPITIKGDHEVTAEFLPTIHRVFSNLKAWLAGTHHGVSPKHLQAYLNEYVFRFNRRFYSMTVLDSVLGIAARTSGPTRAGLARGTWQHSGAPNAGDWASSG